MRFRILFVLVFISLLTGPISAETSTTPSTDHVPVPYGPAEFPDWQKDLRRAEILSFGALPFVTFVSSIYYDVYRYYSNDGQEGYLPWPLKKSESAIGLSEAEQKNIVFYSASISVGVALFDFGFRTLKRAIQNSKAEKENQGYIDPIQIEPVQNKPIPIEPAPGEPALPADSVN